jgi:hypothetical protein
MRLILEEISRYSFKIEGKAFCGNGFIHLNLAEFYEEDIGGQKHALRLTIRVQNERVRPQVGQTV